MPKTMYKNMFNKCLYAVTLFLGLLALTGCDNNKEKDNQSHSKAADVITIMNPFIRALPAGQTVTAMYMQMKNTSSNKHELMRVEGDMSQMIELHTHTNNNGVMQMGQVESIPIEANSVAEAKPGSYHVMIMGLQKDLTLGDTYDFNFIFKDGSNIAVKAEVKTIHLH